MFTGIIEALGEVKAVVEDGSNIHIHIKSDISPELKIDQSVAHNGVCLTVVDVKKHTHTVTAIQETLQKTVIGHLKENDFVNLERSVTIQSRLDGHMVQGHVDTVVECVDMIDKGGSVEFVFNLPSSFQLLMVEKGSICINGVSLTAYNVSNNHFSVAIIPYTYEHTNFKNLQINQLVNIEFDILGKYVQKNIAAFKSN